MAKITLVGEKLAEEGNEFVFIGPLPECSECRIKNVCFNLEPGRSYRITSLREKTNKCSIFEGNKVRAVEIEKIGDFFILEQSIKLQEGATLEINSRKCDHISCENIEACNNMWRKNVRKIKIESIVEKVDCPKGYSLSKVKAEIL